MTVHIDTSTQARCRSRVAASLTDATRLFGKGAAEVRPSTVWRWTSLLRRDRIGFVLDRGRQAGRVVK